MCSFSQQRSKGPRQDIFQGGARLLAKIFTLFFFLRAKVTNRTFWQMFGFLDEMKSMYASRESKIEFFAHRRYKMENFANVLCFRLNLSVE